MTTPVFRIIINAPDPAGNPLALRWARRLIEAHAEAAHDLARRCWAAGNEAEAAKWLHTATYLGTALCAGTDERMAEFDERKAVAIIDRAMQSDSRWRVNNGAWWPINS